MFTSLKFANKSKIMRTRKKVFGTKLQLQDSRNINLYQIYFMNGTLKTRIRFALTQIFV